MQTRRDNRRVLVTGGSGYVGSAVCADLARHGHDVTAFDTRPALTTAPFRQVVGDIADGLRIHEVVREFGVDCIVHAAAMAELSISAQNPVAATRANVLGTAQVIEAARQGDVRRIVFVSSEAAYGVVDRGVASMTEDQPFDPITVYGATKAAGELLLNAFVRTSGIEGVSVRLSEVYGPGIVMPECVYDMVEAGVRDLPYLADAPADQPVGLLYIEDAADALRLALEAPNLGRAAYHVSDGEHHTLGTVAEAVTRLLPSTKIDFPTRSARARLSQPAWDLTAARRELGFVPRWRLADAIHSLIASSRARNSAA